MATPFSCRRSLVYPAFFLMTFLIAVASPTGVDAQPGNPPPPEPSVDSAIEEIYDNEAELVIFTYSLKKDGVVDYVTGRKVINWRVNDYGHGVYDIEQNPVFYWYD